MPASPSQSQAPPWPAVVPRVGGDRQCLADYSIVTAINGGAKLEQVRRAEDNLVKDGGGSELCVRVCGDEVMTWVGETGPLKRVAW